jgi:prophage regulatory protein
MSVRILRLPEVIKRTGLSKSYIYQLINEGTFPKPISLGVRAKGWVDPEVDAWIDVQIRNSRNPKEVAS